MTARARPRVLVRPTTGSRLRLDVTVRRDGLHLRVRGTLDAVGRPRLRRAVTMLERSPRGSTIDLSGVDHATPEGLVPLREAAAEECAGIVITGLSPAVAETAGALGLPTTTPLRIQAWRCGQGS